LAALATVGAVQAQSSVTVYGILDINVSTGKSDAAGAARYVQAGEGSAATSRLGFRGVEDLGGGNRIGFNLEGCLNPASAGTMGTTAALFNREANVDVITKFGTLRVGKTDVTDQINIDIKASLNGNAGLDSITNMGQDRNQVVRYESPTINGFKFQIGGAGAQTSQLVDQTGSNTAATGSTAATVASATRSMYAEYSQGPLLAMVGQTIARTNKTVANTVDLKETSYGLRYQVLPTTALSAYQTKVNGALATTDAGASGYPALSYAVTGNGGGSDDLKMTRFFAQTALPFLGSGVNGTVMYGTDKVSTQSALDATIWNYSVTKPFSKRTTGYVSYRTWNYKSASTADRNLATVGVVHSF